MRKKILLVGCGNIGSRHLQALAKLPFEVNVEIIEPNKISQQLAIKRLNKITYNKKKFNIIWHKDYGNLDLSSDLVIVATTSINRINIISDLLKQGNKKFLIEKIVCQSVLEYDLLIKKLKLYDAVGWVNTNMRYFDSYKKIKNYFKNSKTIDISLTTSGHFGLGTNAIHYLDFFSWFVNDYNITLEGSFLTNKLFPNKRSKSLLEFAGLLSGSIVNGSTVSLNFIPNSKLPLIVNIYGNNNKHLLINETNEKVVNLIDEKTSFNFNYEHTSDLTTKIVFDIIKKNKCDLSTIENSYYLHKELFRVLCKHIEKLTHKRTKICPIT